MSKPRALPSPPATVTHVTEIVSRQSALLDAADMRKLRRRAQRAERAEAVGRAELLRAREELEWVRDQHAQDLRNLVVQRDAALQRADNRGALAVLIAMASILLLAASLHAAAPVANGPPRASDTGEGTSR